MMVIREASIKVVVGTVISTIIVTHSLKFTATIITVV